MTSLCQAGLITYRITLKGFTAFIPLSQAYLARHNIGSYPRVGLHLALLKHLYKFTSRVDHFLRKVLFYLLQSR
jgi:hypothetical protein